MDVVDKIAAVRVDRSSRPYDEVTIIGITEETVE